ncbi:TonB-dependent receptor [Costertonia aggregata]|uniref:TonB-dependent receptor plug domain-containing protein n=1 Tax=Costertonia aggregata TaxID=343403 RepID=A0A7H9AKE0_9FLAO|nr:TonB-dependent receptor plug domain-containing protein [Costertonia aggregata]QLG43949.1 TonB-dependent receptor plug domain-containing protein [Costertonia aggregata]
MFLLFSVYVNSQKTNHTIHTEKIYLHINKTFFTAGEDIWFKIYLVNGITNRPLTPSQIVYVELIGPNFKILEKKTFKSVESNDHGNFKIPVRAKKGVYTLRAYTNYMRNFDDSIFFRKNVFVNTSNTLKNKYKNNSKPDTVDVTINKNISTSNKQNIDIQFFPEGGHMVNGFLNHVAFKAIDSNGKGIPVSGEIIDETGTKIIEFNTSYLGMGKFYFIPKSGKTYWATISDIDLGKSFFLPKALNNGILMTLVDDRENYRLDIRSSLKREINNFKIIGKQKQNIIFETKINTDKKSSSAIVRITKDIFKEGIVQLTLMDNQNKPLAERLLFHDNGNKNTQSIVSASENKNVSRNLINLEIDMKPYYDTDETVNMSLAVVDKAVTAPQYSTDIKTFLLLNSQLRGKIEQPGYYFYSNGSDRKQHLDLLMMTQGWRQYLVDKYEVKTKPAVTFLPENDISIKGKVKYQYHSNKQINAEVSLFYKNKEEMGQDKIKTDTLGNFVFSNLTFTDTTTVLLTAAQYGQSAPKKKNEKDFSYVIELDSLESPKIRSEMHNQIIRKKFVFDDFTSLLERAENNSNKFFYSNNIIQLKEYTGNAQKNKKKTKYELKRRFALYNVPSHTVDFEELRRDFPNIDPILALQGRIPGLSIRGNGAFLRGSGSLSGSTNNKVLLLLNGTPIFDDPFLLAIDIDFIDIIKGPRAAIYGSRAANGIIAIYTRDGSEESFDANNGDKSNSIHFSHQGLNKPKKFYEPKYDIKENTLDEPDYRDTLCWRPNITLDENGMAKISFYASDIPSTYKVILEGVTSKGNPIKAITQFDITARKEK